jgi:hypothetical protein
MMPVEDSSARQRPVRLPRAADEGKYEPLGRGFDPVTGRYAADAPHAGNTMALPPVDSGRTGGGLAGGWVGPSVTGEDWTSAAGYGGFSTADWLRRAPVSSVPDARPGADAAQSGREPSDAASAAPARMAASELDEAAASSVGGRRCRVCAAELADGDRFCARCGSPSR